MFTSQKPSGLNQYSENQQRLIEEQKCACIETLLSAILHEDERRIKQEREQKAAERAEAAKNNAAAGESKSVFIGKGYLIPTYSSKFAEDYYLYDSMLILKSRKEAIQTGEEILQRLFQQAGQEVDLEKIYKTMTDETADVLKQMFDAINDDDTLDKIGVHAYTLAISRSFLSLQHFINDLPEPVVAKLSAYYMDLCAYKAIHYGDAEAFDFLLDKCVDPNLINTHDFLGCYRPLNLLVHDLGRCAQKTMKLIEDARSGTEARFGTVEELQQFYARRINAHQEMISSLLKHGADPDIQPDATVKIAGRLTPREVAASMLEGLDEHYKELAPQMKTVLQLIADAPKLEAEFQNVRMAM